MFSNVIFKARDFSSVVYMLARYVLLMLSIHSNDIPVKGTSFNKASRNFCLTLQECSQIFCELNETKVIVPCDKLTPLRTLLYLTVFLNILNIAYFYLHTQNENNSNILLFH